MHETYIDGLFAIGRNPQFFQTQTFGAIEYTIAHLLAIPRKPRTNQTREFGCVVIGTISGRIFAFVNIPV